MSTSLMRTEVTTCLRTLLGDHPGTAALKKGTLTSDRVAFDFADYSPTHKGFKPMVRDAAFDVSEMAIVTYLMARSVGKPMVLLPNVVMARFQHGHALVNGKRAAMTAADLNGKRVGIRSFTTTTGAWLRGILANDYGLDLESIDWVTFEDAHVAEYKDTTKRAPSGKQIVQMLVDGELDAILGEKSDHPDLHPLFADVAAEEKAWFARHGVRPINHMVVVSRALCETQPDAVREVSQLLTRSADAASGSPRFVAAEIRKSLELIISYCAQQGLIPRAMPVDELFEGETQKLWREAR